MRSVLNSRIQCPWTQRRQGVSHLKGSRPKSGGRTGCPGRRTPHAGVTSGRSERQTAGKRDGRKRRDVPFPAQRDRQPSSRCARSSASSDGCACGQRRARSPAMAQEDLLAARSGFLSDLSRRKISLPAEPERRISRSASQPNSFHRSLESLAVRQRPAIAALMVHDHRRILIGKAKREHASGYSPLERHDRSGRSCSPVS